jgi:hypothetical protein
MEFLGEPRARVGVGLRTFFLGGVGLAICHLAATSSARHTHTPLMARLLTDAPAPWHCAGGFGWRGWMDPTCKPSAVRFVSARSTALDLRGCTRFCTLRPSHNHRAQARGANRPACPGLVSFRDFGLQIRHIAFVCRPRWWSACATPTSSMCGSISSSSCSR